MNRTTLLRKIKTTGQDLAKNKVQRENLRWVLAGFCTQLKATYPAGGEKAFLAAAATESGLTEGDIGNLVRAFEVKQDLTKAQGEKTETWTTDAMLTLRGKDMTAGNRTKVIAKATAKGTQNVKTLREIKKSVVGTTPRQRQNATDAKIALAKKHEKLIERLIKQHDVLALIAGAQFAQDNPGADVVAVLTFAAAQVTKTATPTS